MRMKAPRNRFGIKMIFVNSFVENRRVTKTKMFTKRRAVKRLKRKSELFSKMSGPGLIPASKKTTIIIAVRASPGTPSARSGIIAAAGTELLEVSEAIKPSGAPWPNLSGVLEKARAVE